MASYGRFALVISINDLSLCTCVAIRICFVTLLTNVALFCSKLYSTVEKYDKIYVSGTHEDKIIIVSTS